MNYTGFFDPFGNNYAIGLARILVGLIKIYKKCVKLTFGAAHPKRNLPDFLML
jgi:hypothetical protein